MVPTMFIRLLKLPEEVRRRYDVSSLRYVIHAAAPCPAEVKRAMIEWWGPVIYEFYGGTENGPVTFATSEDSLEASRGRWGGPRRARKSAFSTTTASRCRRGRSARSIRASRTIRISSTTICRTRRPRSLRDGLISLGDIGYLDEDGYLFICDRKRDMVISGGINIYPAEIEAVLHADARGAGLRGVRRAGRRIRRGLDGGGRAAAGRGARCRPRCAGRWRPIWPTTRCPSTSRSGAACRARIPARSSSAACAIPIGRRRAGGFREPRAADHFTSPWRGEVDRRRAATAGGRG